MCRVKMLDLANSEVEESHVILDFERRLRAGHTCATSDREGDWRKEEDAPMEVPRPPLTFSTASLLRFCDEPGESFA